VGYSFGVVNGGWDTFFICAPWQVMASTGTTIEPDDYLWVTGTKPSGVYESDVSSVDVDGDNYTVWTTDALSDVGVGFILRWRAQASYFGVGEGTWRYPTSGWNVDVPPSSDGFPFYQSTYIERYPRPEPCPNIPYPNFSSLDDFRNSQNVSGCTQNTNTAIVYYGARVEIRYVLTKPVSSLGELNDITSTPSVTTDFVILKGRQASHLFTGQATVSHTVAFRLPPTGTCQTPSVEEGTVRFGMVNQSDFPNDQWGAASGAERDFTLTFRNCPRYAFRYYFHANGNKWVDSVRGVVGVHDSVPGAADPIEGNPSGFAIQLQQYIHAYGSNYYWRNAYIHPNEVAQPSVLKTTEPYPQAYQRAYNGAGTVNDPALGVTHTIPMRARLVRTGSSSQQQIQTGPFNTSVIVAIHYP